MIQMVNFLQVNLNNCWAAEQLMFQTAADSDTDIFIVSEPYTKHGNGDNWCSSTDGSAAVATTHATSFVRDGQGSGDGFAWMSIGELTVFSCYWRPSTTLDEYALFLGDLEAAIRARGSASIVLAGDFNAWNIERGSRANNPRGVPLSDLASSLGLILANSGTTPTFVRGAATSIIDVTFYRGVDLTGWHVPHLETLSDHNYVCFSTVNRAQAPVQAELPANVHRGWFIKKLDTAALYRYLSTTRLGAPVGAACAEKALS